MEPTGAALVTGASRGLGRAIALELARRGFDVVATMRDPAAGAALADEARAAGARLSVARLDVRSPGAFRMPDRLRVLVNNAGVDAASDDAVEHQPLADWRALFETNVFGLVAVLQRAVPALRASGGGVVCNLTSAALCFPMPFYAAYRASKAAVAALGESLRAELAPQGIRVLEVRPGPIATDMLAASDRPAAAGAHAPYRSLAARAEAGRRDATAQATPAAEAARAIADAILDDDAPLRVACDALGAGLLAGWRSSEDETWMRSLLASFSGGSD